MCHYSAGCSLSSLMLTSCFPHSSYCFSPHRYFMTISVLLPFSLPWASVPRHPCYCLFQLRSQLGHSCLSVRLKDRRKKASLCADVLPHIAWQQNYKNKNIASYFCFVISLKFCSVIMPGENPGGDNNAFFADHVVHRPTARNYLVIRTRRNLSNTNAPSAIISCSV